jgi:LysM repeat protein
MNYKVAINPVGGGSDTGLKSGNVLEKNVSLLVSNYIKNRLDELGIENVITRTTDNNISLDERIDFIDNSFGFGDDVIVITNGLSDSSVSGVEIIYALRDSSSFAKTLAEQFENSDIDVNKYYQLRMEEDTALDGDYIIRNTGDSESVIINYASVSNSDDLNKFVNNYEDYGEAVVRAVAIYTKNDYVPTSKGNYYTVKKGDSLYKIARLYDVSVEDIKTLNKLSSNILAIGQILRIPDIVEKNDTSVYYVKKGDTLYGIAKSYSVSVDDIKKLNNLNSNSLSIGQELLISGLSSENTLSVKVYTVVKGDSLYKIANLYGVSVEELKTLNKLTSSVLSIGQQLVIPNSDTSKTYVVKRGDTLYGIASDNNTTVDRIKSLNGLSGNTLSVGQILKL